MVRRTIALILGLAIPACRQPAAGTPPNPEVLRPNVLLITFDTLRADHCSAYGYGRPTTPRIERLASGGVRCDVAYAPMPTTGPSHATMFTGLFPLSHGVRKNGETLRDQELTLAEVLGANGYQTAAMVGSYAVHHAFGLAQGFTVYDDRFSGERSSMKSRRWEGLAVEGAFDRRADETRTQALEWLGQHGYLRPSRAGAPELPPFFLWVHFFDPHDPYDPPSDHGALFPARAGASGLERQIAAYDGEIHFADAELGNLLDALGESGRLGKTLTIVTADHGEGLMDHGHMKHGLFLYEEAVRVPLVFHWPGRLPAGLVVETPVQLVDLLPTVLDLLGLVTEAGPREGVSLKSALLGRGNPEPDRPIFLERRAFVTPKVDGFVVRGDKAAVRAGKWKYIEAQEEDSFELYDLSSDPLERRNLTQAFPREAQALASLLQKWLRTRPDRPDVRGPGKEDIERLRALGYVQ